MQKDKEYELFAIQTAKDLGYGKEVINKIKNCLTDNEISNVLTNARLASC